MIHQGDCLEVMRGMVADTIDCCITSPPYWGLRDYGVDGQLGLEPTPDEYIAKMVEVFAEVRRLLKPKGTCWLNLGDSYARAPSKGPKFVGETLLGEATTKARSHRGMSIPYSLKPKDLCMIPARAALALQANGWYLRSDIIWHKPNPMPESCKDRPTSAHEHIYLLTKAERYYYDADAIRTPAIAATQKMPDGWDTGSGGHGKFHREGRERGQRTDKQRGHVRRHAGFNARWDSMSKDEQQANGANARNVWTIATMPYSKAHFATFPPELPRRCILAGCAPGGIVLDPFFGSGTVGEVAEKLGRKWVGIELNAEYVELAKKRTRQRGICMEVGT